MNLKVHEKWAVGFMLMLTVSLCGGITDPRDVFAINSLYAAMGSPQIPGWIPLGGDPCSEAWQGVLCVNSNITGISLISSNLGGELGTNLDSFTSIISIDLSGNHIGGPIPANLPRTLTIFYLSGNQFTGSIPDLSSLSQLTDMSLKDNHLTDEIPDAFQQLTVLINLDLSGNNLTGPLPPSMGNLSALTTLHLQDNKLAGTLDVLQNLPLTDLNIENNQFSGPIPPTLLTIPNFRSTGNPFNTTVLPSAPAASPTLAPNSSVPQVHTPPKQPENTPSAPETSTPAKSAKYMTTRWTILGAAIVAVVLIVVVFGLWFCLTRYCKRKQANEGFSTGLVKTMFDVKGEIPNYNESLPQARKEVGKASQETSLKISNVSIPDHKQVTDAKETPPVSMAKDDHAIDMTGKSFSTMSNPPVPPPRHYSSENITFNSITPSVITKPLNSSFPHSVKSFTVASLQQYTNSFSQENLIGEGMLGSVYRAELPDKKLVAVKKLSKVVSRRLTEDQFAELVSVLSEIQHENIAKLVAYCAEYGQRLIVFEYCNNGTLYDALHLDDEIHKRLSWNVRIRISLGAAKSLEYLHEVCEPPVVHKNFKSTNILLDDCFEPIVSDCGLGSLLSDSYATQLSNGYGAPELEMGTYTHQSDVFSFGVVMLELLTGRKPYDRTRPRGEQYLVRWAIPQLHDIDALSKMVDPLLNGSYPSKSLSRFADIISLCVQAEPEFRPPMSEIVQKLLNMMQRET